MYQPPNSLALTADAPFPAILSEVLGDIVIWGCVILLLTVLGILGFWSSRNKVKQEELVMDFWSDCLRRLRERRAGRGTPAPHDLLLEAFTEWMRREEREGVNAPRVEDNEEITEQLRRQEARLANKDEELSLLEERLLLISSRTNRNNNMSFMPHISELHELSLQRMESDLWFKILYMTTATVLICGICGTLWSVHLELPYINMKEFTMAALAPSLLPSGFAVVANILLTILRNLLARELDYRLGELDNLTLTLFTPALQPKSRIGQEYENFKDQTSIFSSMGENSPFKSFCATFCDMPRQMQQAMGGLQHLPGKLITLFNEQKKLCKLALDQLRELLTAQAQQMQLLGAWAEKLIQAAHAIYQLRQEQASMVTTLHNLHQVTAASALDSGEFYSDHMKASTTLVEAMASLATNISTLRQWKMSCAQTEALCQAMLCKVDVHTELIACCARSAAELSQAAETLPQQLSQLTEQWQHCILEHAGSSAQFAPISAAAGTFERKMQEVTDNQRTGMSATARMALDHRHALAGTHDILQKAGTNFTREANKTSIWPRVYAYLITFLFVMGSLLAIASVLLVLFLLTSLFII